MAGLPWKADHASAGAPIASSSSNRSGLRLTGIEASILRVCVCVAMGVSRGAEEGRGEGLNPAPRYLSQKSQPQFSTSLSMLRC